MSGIEMINVLRDKGGLNKEQWHTLIASYGEEERRYAEKVAREITDNIFGKEIYLRALVEISNICKNDCLYCGIRRSNTAVSRYRMTDNEILDCCERGYEAGYKTFVLQGGEDSFFSDDVLCDILRKIRNKYPECAITVSMGERSTESYRKIKEAGADRYLLRHETANSKHYRRIHPKEMSPENRMECLNNLKSIGFQTGCGMMVGTPYQTDADLAEDMYFMQRFKPHMIGIGPFIPAVNTPFEAEKAGDLNKTIFLLSLCRIMHPKVLLPATTALATMEKDGREKAILAGANVIMPNISPTQNRRKYLLYDNKAGIMDDIAKSRNKVMKMLEKIGYTASAGRGDYDSI